MSNEICICCAEKMAASSPRNPNICPGCEQLLADDCFELEKLLAGGEPPSLKRTDSARRDASPDDFFLSPSDD